MIPTHAFLPPHPSSFLAKNLLELAKEADDVEGYQKRQNEVSTYWEETEKRYITPILEQLDHSIRQLVMEALYNSDASPSSSQNQAEPVGQPNLSSEVNTGRDLKQLPVEDPIKQANMLEGDDPFQKPRTAKPEYLAQQSAGSEVEGASQDLIDSPHQLEDLRPEPKDLSPIDLVIKNLRAAYIAARKAYRIHPERLARVRSVLAHFLGTHNFHNYTIQKNYRDPSAKRVIKSFVVHGQPLLINGTEWLSLKVHGQSFMMHQIRKMVSMTALVVRCGCHEDRLQDSYLQHRLSIPKAPGLGLLLERPVFDTYNERLVGQFGRESIDFRKFEKEMEEFKQREIYKRIFQEEERDHQFVSPLSLRIIHPRSGELILALSKVSLLLRLHRQPQILAAPLSFIHRRPSHKETHPHRVLKLGIRETHYRRLVLRRWGWERRRWLIGPISYHLGRSSHKICCCHMSNLGIMHVTQING